MEVFSEAERAGYVIKPTLEGLCVEKQGFALHFICRGGVLIDVENRDSSLPTNMLDLDQDETITWEDVPRLLRRFFRSCEQLQERKEVLAELSLKYGGSDTTTLNTSILTLKTGVHYLNMLLTWDIDFAGHRKSRQISLFAYSEVSVSDEHALIIASIEGLFSILRTRVGVVNAISIIQKKLKF